ncbi:MAG TPA: M20/M25/M40 family metallo-hydrolase [Gemmatimonadales bacterium]|nr:M20/M25/M40 family metallo-hydrolase [Gemmatimonadales bacterium]
MPAEAGPDALAAPELALLRELVAIPSVSGSEEAVARFAEAWARAQGLDVVRDETGVKLEVRGRAAGPTLALASHLDVVPPGEGWTRDPFAPVVEAGRLYGRGSGDAKASVAAMLTAAADVAAAGGPGRGRLLVLLGYGEETRHTSMPAAVASVGAIDAAIVGEPTNLDLAVAQRGLMMVDLVARGDQRHAGYADPDANGEFTNAALALAEDLLRLPHVARDRAHPVLGHPTITPTMLEAGVSRNVTPPSARAVLDIRSTPAWPHAELAAALRSALRSEVVVTSDRLVPCETPAGSPLLAAARRVRPAARVYGSPTCSDWVFLRHADAVKCGPGTSRRSHTPDECVELAEVTAARAFYGAVAREYLA